MLTRSIFRQDFAQTRAPAQDLLLPLPTDSFIRHEALDPIEQMALADAADRTLLRLMIYAAIATLLLAVASSMA